MITTGQYLFLRHPADVIATTMVMCMPAFLGVPIGKALAHRRHAEYDRTAEDRATTTRKIDGYWGGGESRPRKKHKRERSRGMGDPCRECY